MYPSIFGTSWKALEHELSHTLHSSIQCYWTRWSAGHDTKCHLPQPQVCLACWLERSLFRGTVAVNKLHASYMHPKAASACPESRFCILCLHHGCYGQPVRNFMLHQGDLAPLARPFPPCLPLYLGSKLTVTPTLAS